MLRAIRIFYLSFLIIIFLIGQKPFSQELRNLTGAEVLALYEQLKKLELDQTKIAPVKNFILKKDVGIINLEEGEIYLLPPVSGKVTGAVFIGEGTFKFSPPTEIERYQLEKFTEYNNLLTEFKELYLRFSDSTDRELSRLNFSAGNIPGNAKDISNSGEKRSQKILDLNPRILSDILEEKADGLFYADIKSRSGNRLFFLYDPKEVEEVTLLQEFKLGFSPFLPKGGDQVCSFHKENDYSWSTSLESEDKDEIKIKHYKMEVTLSTSGNLDANCEVDFSFLKSNLRILDFLLAEKLKVSQVKDESGKGLSFIQEEDMPFVSVILENPSSAGQNIKIAFSYSGDVLDKNDYGDFYVKYSILWYPLHSSFNRATFDLSFNTPTDFKFVTIGRKIMEKKEKGRLYTQWAEDIPIKYATFNMGDFEVLDLKNEGIPEVIVYHNASSDKQYTIDHMDDFVTMSAHPMENIGKDVVNSLNFFQKIFAKCIFPIISVTEVPEYGGQGSPGLLHLSWTTFMGEGIKGEEESFRAHEVSHQWWGHTVRGKTYHDKWLDEGLAEYSGALYAQVYLKDNKKFFEMLEKWQKYILGKEKFFDGGFESKGTIAGPLWLGNRLTSSKSFDYDILVYLKGAYVIHMLRNMLMDFNTMNDDRFINLIKDYVQTYSGKEATTEDFKQIVDKHFSEDMSWFFNQWVYGIEIPTYIVSWDIEQTEDGKYIVNLKVKQENVSESFKMVVPVVMNFGADKYSIVKVLIDKPYTEVKLPKTPISLKGIVFNPFYSVLCEVKYK